MTKRPSRGVTSGIGPPTKMDGRDGDLTIRKTRDGKILYVKEHGAWHPINTGIDIAALRKDVDRLTRNFNSSQNDYNFSPTLTEVNIKTYSDGTGFKLKNNAGMLSVRNSADNADAIIRAKRLQVDAATSGTTDAVVGEFQYNSAANSFVTHGQGFLVDAATTGSSGDIGVLAVASDTADSVIKVFDGSTIKWTMGYDQSDSNKFKIHDSGTLADTSKLMLDTDGTLNLIHDVIITPTGGDRRVLLDPDNSRIRLYDDTVGDFFTMSVGTNGATTLATMDADANLANLTLDAKGDIVLDASSGITHFRDAGDTDDEFMITVTGGTGATKIQTVSAGADGHIIVIADVHVEFDGCGVGFDLVTPTFNAADTNVDFKTGNKQMVTLTDNLSDLNLTFPATSGNFTLLLKQDGTGSRTMAADGWLAFESGGSAATVPAVKFPGGTSPTLTTDANHVDIVSFFWDADNQVCYGAITLDFQD